MQPSEYLVGFVLGVLVVIGTSIWVLIDSSTHRIPINDSKPYSANTGAWAWLGTCLVLWIVGFPYYLVRRSQVLHHQQAEANRPMAHWPVRDQTRMPAGPANAGGYCARCGAALLVGAGFCHVCGTATPSS